jgi:hypothetical protein
MKRILTAAFPFLVLILCIFLAICRFQPPPEVPAGAPDSVFSSGRAMAHLRAIASQPHNVGTVAHDRVRDYLTGELRKLGLEPVIQRVTSVRNSRVAIIENIIAEKPGLAAAGTILLSAHYDSRFLSPGAGDNGANVAAILESLRALKYGPPLRNNLRVLFTDGEEEALLGSAAFISDTSLSNGIGLVLNFDGRGSSGVSVMFESSRLNEKIIREMNQAIPGAVANAFSSDATKGIPNYTDFLLLMRKASAGLNFTHLGSVQTYHSERDDISRFDERTLQSNGNNMLALLTHFGSGNLDLKGDTDVIYYPLFNGLVIYTLPVAIFLAVLSTLFFIAVIAFGIFRRQMHLGKILLASLIFLARIPVAGLIVFFLWKWLGPLQPGFRMFELEWVYHSGLYLAAFVCISAAVVFVFRDRLNDKLGSLNAAAGSLAVFPLFMWVAVILYPGISYLFTWPLICILTGFLLFLLLRLSPGSRISITIFTLLAVPGIFLFTQLAFLLYAGLTILTAGVMAAVAVVFFATFQVPLNGLTGKRCRMIPVSFLVISVALIMAALSLRSPENRHPLPDTMFYLLDADNGHAHWATWDRSVDEWTGRFLGSDPGRDPFGEFLFFERYGPFRGTPMLCSPAPAALFSGPLAEIVHDTITGAARELDIRIHSKDSACIFLISPEPGITLRELRINGRIVGHNDLDRVHPFPLLYFCHPGESPDLRILTDNAGPLKLRIAEAVFGLPAFPSGPDLQRPANTFPCPGFFDGTIVARTVRF